MLCQVVHVLKVSQKIFAVYIVVIYFKKLNQLQLWHS